MKFTQDCLEQIYRLRKVFDDADAIVIGAGAGLSTAAGLEYSGKRFEKYFSDFEQKYGFHDMYSGGFYPYSTPEEFWAYWSRYIFINRYSDAPRPVYQTLYELVKDKNYFVVTTNVDHCFQKAGFDKARLFYTQGDYGLFQCSTPCHNKTYDNRDIVLRMVNDQKDMRVPSKLIPHCPVCGKPMTTNLRADDKFVQDDGWYAACERYKRFIMSKTHDKVLFLELGVGYNTPAIIKYPFWKMASENKNATYVCVNKGEAFCPERLGTKSFAIDEDIGDTLFILKEIKKQ